MSAAQVPPPAVFPARAKRRAILLLLTMAAVLASATLARLHAAVTLTILYNFDTDPDTTGTGPAGGLILARDGNFYGTTSDSILGGYGTIFRLTPAGVLTTLHAFNGQDGNGPVGTLFEAADGSFYGTTQYDGPAGNGTIFRLAPDGTLTTLHAFTGDEGSEPVAGLIQASDGNFYGTAQLGGDNHYGTIFRLAPDGSFTVLHRFESSNGRYVNAALIQAADGNLYGSTRSGGTHNDGTIFRLTLDGTFTSLHDFSGTDGSSPVAALLQASDGNFYGTTANGNPTGGLGEGTVFRMTPDGTLTTLYFFDGTDGYGPTAGLIQGGDGNFYGTTSQGGSRLGEYDLAYTSGTVFRLTPDGGLTTLRAFDRADVVSPTSTLVLGPDGTTLYGTAVGSDDDDDGSVLNNGSVFQLALDAPATVPAVTATVVVANADAYGDFEQSFPSYGAILLSLSTPPTSKIKVNYTIRGSAEPGKDYDVLSGKVKFKPGQTEKLITVLPRLDSGHTTERVVRLRLQPGSGYTLATTTLLKVKILPP